MKRKTRRIAKAEREIDVVATVRGAPPVRHVEAWARRLLSELGAKRRLSLSILLCGDARMRSLNRRFRRIDRPTDVLSFPSFEESPSSRSPRGAGFLGDLVIDIPCAARQARRLGHPVGREIQILLAHGLLHLLGYDHETDDGTMFRLQRLLILSAFGDGPDGVP